LSGGTASFALSNPDPADQQLYRELRVTFAPVFTIPATTMVLQVEGGVGGFFDPCGQNPSGDVDADGDIDLKDFALMQRCFAGASPRRLCDAMSVTTATVMATWMRMTSTGGRIALAVPA
jgi:hypothetical protein